jgi:hypothetical protein
VAIVIHIRIGVSQGTMAGKDLHINREEA